MTNSLLTLQQGMRPRGLRMKEWVDGMDSSGCVTSLAGTTNSIFQIWSGYFCFTVAKFDIGFR